MLKNKRKIEFNNDELRLMTYALNDFRSKTLKENKHTDAINDVIRILKNKTKVDKYELGVMINALVEKKKTIDIKNADTTIINNLLTKLFQIYEYWQT